MSDEPQVERSCDERLNADLARLAELAERNDLVTLGTIFTVPSEPRPVLAVINKDGTIDTFGKTLDEAIAALWAQHADAPAEATPGFYAAMALLEVRSLAAGIADTETPRHE